MHDCEDCRDKFRPSTSPSVSLLHCTSCVRATSSPPSPVHLDTADSSQVRPRAIKQSATDQVQLKAPLVRFTFYVTAPRTSHHISHVCISPFPPSPVHLDAAHSSQVRPCIIERSARWQVQVKAPSVNIVKVLHQDLAHCFCCALLWLQRPPTGVPAAVLTAVAAVAAPAAGVSCCGFRCYPPAKVSSCLLPSKLLLLPLLLFATVHVAAAVDAYAGGGTPAACCCCHHCCCCCWPVLLLLLLLPTPIMLLSNLLACLLLLEHVLMLTTLRPPAAAGTASVVAGTPICG